MSSDEKLSATAPRSPSDKRDRSRSRSRSMSPEPKKSSKKGKKAKNNIPTAHDIAVSYCPVTDLYFFLADVNVFPPQT